MVLSEPAHAKQLIFDSLVREAPVCVTFKKCAWYEPPMYAMQLDSSLGHQVWPGLYSNKECMIQNILDTMQECKLDVVKVNDDEYKIQKRKS